MAVLWRRRINFSSTTGVEREGERERDASGVHDQNGPVSLVNEYVLRTCSKNRATDWTRHFKPWRAWTHVSNFQKLVGGGRGAAGVHQEQDSPNFFF